jgi:hypothetical protein
MGIPRLRHSCAAEVSFPPLLLVFVDKNFFFSVRVLVLVEVTTNSGMSSYLQMVQKFVFHMGEQPGVFAMLHADHCSRLVSSHPR